MFTDKQPIDSTDLDAQAVIEIPDRHMLGGGGYGGSRWALVNIDNVQILTFNDFNTCVNAGNILNLLGVQNQGCVQVS